jgi:hypothetical protein
VSRATSEMCLSFAALAISMSDSMDDPSCVTPDE